MGMCYMIGFWNCVLLFILLGDMFGWVVIDFCLVYCFWNFFGSFCFVFFKGMCYIIGFWNCVLVFSLFKDMLGCVILDFCFVYCLLSLFWILRVFNFWGFLVLFCI